MFAIWRKQSSLTSAKSRTRWSWIKNCTTIWNRFSIPYIFISFIFRIQLRSGYQAACWLRILGLRAFGEEMLIESILTTFMIVKKGFWYQSQNYGPPQSSREASFHMISLETQSFGGASNVSDIPIGGEYGGMLPKLYTLIPICESSYAWWFQTFWMFIGGGLFSSRADFSEARNSFGWSPLPSKSGKVYSFTKTEPSPIYIYT